MGSYRHFLAAGKDEDRQEFCILSNVVRSKTRIAQQESWDRYILDLEINILDLYFVWSTNCTIQSDDTS